MEQMFTVPSRRGSDFNSDNVLDVRADSNGEVNPQQQCPIFSRLPRELRDEIFSYALLNTCHDPFHRGFSQSARAPKRHDIALPLLLTCRAIHIETQHLPISLNAIFVGSPAINFPSRNQSRLGQQLLRNNIQAADYTIQQTFLESAHFQTFLHAPSRNIKFLTLRLERTDWWTWETPPGEVARDGGLAVDPNVGDGSVARRPTAAVMRELARKRREGVRDGRVLSAEHARGLGFGWAGGVERAFPGLRGLEIVFESFAAKRAQLEEVVGCAETWEFGMGQGFVLRCVGVERGSWGEGVEVQEGKLRWHRRSGAQERRVEWQQGPFEVRVVRWKRVRV
ncbi:hypothetical protein BU16DRAFT_619105 [Lophium mytilinum]|uniref:Uncharacterized protein n=1 Tax=Lophium mytilinum TaxID=390894 RepID=A0A6A6QN11_9PEZI|nr:hypothetical protein BU16DRAFT_619105 [Lophium mytilinum]